MTYPETLRVRSEKRECEGTYRRLGGGLLVWRHLTNNTFLLYDGCKSLCLDGRGWEHFRKVLLRRS